MRLGPRLEVRKEGLDHVNLAPQVHIDHAFDQLIAQIGKIDERLDDAGTVDDRIDSAMFGNHLIGQLLNPLAIRDIGHMCGKLVACGQTGEFRKAFGPEIDGRNPRAARQKSHHEGAPNTAAAAGDNKDFVLYFHGSPLQDADAAYQIGRSKNLTLLKPQSGA